MPGSKRATPDVARERILDAAISVLTQGTGGPATVERVAREAGCAKGLVHYHFKTKDALLASAGAKLWTERAAAWRQALAGGEPHAALRNSWQLLREEAQNGRLLACTSLGLGTSKLAGQTVRDGRTAFARASADGVVALFERMGRAAAVPPSEIASLLAAVIDGLGLQLATGEKPDDMEPAWSAFWAAVLSLTTSG